MRQYLYRLYFVTSLDNCCYLSTYKFIVLDYTTLAIELKTRAPHCRKRNDKGRQEDKYLAPAGVHTALKCETK